MHSENGDNTNDVIAVSRVHERRRDKLGAGFIVSVALHALALTALVVALGLAASPTEDLVIVPADIVRLADTVVGPNEPDKAIIPQQEVAAPASPSPKSNEISPAATRPPPNDLEIKLRRLAELRRPLVDQNLSQKSEGLSHVSTMKQDAAPGINPTIKDFLRDQIDFHLCAHGIKINRSRHYNYISCYHLLKQFCHVILLSTSFLFLQLSHAVQ